MQGYRVRDQLSNLMNITQSTIQTRVNYTYDEIIKHVNILGKSYKRYFYLSW